MCLCSCGCVCGGVQFRGRSRIGAHDEFVEGLVHDEGRKPWLRQQHWHETNVSPAFLCADENVTLCGWGERPRTPDGMRASSESLEAAGHGSVRSILVLGLIQQLFQRQREHLVLGSTTFVVLAPTNAHTAGQSPDQCRCGDARQ